MTSATIMWFAVNFIFDRFLGLPRYRYTIPRGYDFHERSAAQAAETSSLANQPGFLERVPDPLGIDDVLALKAEQHYIRIYSKEREYMVLYRFSDAVRELGHDIGTQVHRSYWVNTDAIDSVKPRAKKFVIRLITGDEIPVSTPYHAVVRELARSRKLKVRP